MVTPATTDTEELRKIRVFENTLEKLESSAADRPEFITLYIPPDKTPEAVREYLKDEYEKTDLIRDDTTRVHVRNALSSTIT